MTLKEFLQSDDTEAVAAFYRDCCPPEWWDAYERNALEHWDNEYERGWVHKYVRLSGRTWYVFGVACDNPCLNDVWNPELGRWLVGEGDTSETAYACETMLREEDA
jgi:hypothetical protein